MSFTGISKGAASADISLTTADASLTTRVAAEETARTAADASLTTRVAAEETARASADTSLTTADASLTTRVAAEETARTAADASLTTRVAAEETARASAVSSLETKVVNHLNDIATEGLLSQVATDVSSKLTDGSDNVLVGQLALAIHDRNARDTLLTTAITNISNFLKVFRGTYTLTESGQAEDAYFPAASFDSIVTTLSFSDEAANLSSLISL